MFVISKLFCLFLLIICEAKCEKLENTCHSIDGGYQNVATTEYIVLFKSYYTKQTRENYINSILYGNNLRGLWNFTTRPKMSNMYPSDFEVVCSSYQSIGEILVKHPAVKRVVKEAAVKLETVSDHRNYSRLYAERHAVKSASSSSQLTDMLGAPLLWKRGITGKGVKVAVFDTGLPKRHPHFRNVKERTDWTNEKSLDDGVSHGTFVTGVIASSSKECLGLAPDAELHIFRVFTSLQVSYTSWFLDAFNYAMFKKINILNLSIGGPDWMDQPFVDKVLELSANKVIIVSAIGNDGPLYGTLNNPGDQSDVVGVGCINPDDVVSKFSSRGMTTWELPRGYGRLKPDIVTYGSHVKGSDVNGGCRSLSGTSVAAPVVAGAVALILSGAPQQIGMANQASVKQILTEAADRLRDSNIFEQGYGKLNILRSMELLASYTPKLTLSPPYIDHSEAYMWPYNSQALYCQSMPFMVNVTIWNAVSVRAAIKQQPIWYPESTENSKGELLDVKIEYSPILWPWSGWMSVKIMVNAKDGGCFYEGEAKGHIRLEIEVSPIGENLQTISLNFPISLQITPKPPRHKRILWDQYHNLQYPPGYIPRDNLKTKSDPLDWRGDHLHTNFRDMYLHLRSLGYYIDILGMPYTCFDARNYAALLIVDPEEEFFDEEIYKLQRDVFDYGLSVIIFADWYNTTVMKKMKFFDENTREWWIPDTGGANIPALNDLLSAYGISLSDTVAEGNFRLGEHNVYYASGTSLNEFPKNAHNIIISALLNDQGSEVLNNVTQQQKSHQHQKINKQTLPIIGLFQLQTEDRKDIAISKEFEKHNADEETAIENEELDKWNILNKRVLLSTKNEINFRPAKNSNAKQSNKLTAALHNQNPIGRLVIMGDSNCIDSTATTTQQQSEQHSCMWLLNIFLEYTIHSHTAPFLKKLNSMQGYITATTPPSPQPVPAKRLNTSKLYTFSKVLDKNKKGSKRELEKCENIGAN